jgi:hypothetical protein
VIFPLVKRPAIMSRLLAKTNQLGIAYPNSPLTLTTDERHRGPRPGYRAPDARGTTADGTAARLFDVTRGTHWTVLGFGTQTIEALRDLGNTYREQIRTCLVVDSAGSRPTNAPRMLVGTEARRLFQAHPDTLILIRPDGYIAARTPNSGTITDYLSHTLPPNSVYTPSTATRLTTQQLSLRGIGR